MQKLKGIGFAYASSTIAQDVNGGKGCWFSYTTSGNKRLEYTGPFPSKDAAETYLEREHPDLDWCFYSMRRDVNLEKWRKVN